MDAHAIDQQQVLMGDLAHHAGGLKEGLEGEKKDHEGTQTNTMEEWTQRKENEKGSGCHLVAVIMDIIYVHLNKYFLRTEHELDVHEITGHCRCIVTAQSHAISCSCARMLLIY